MINNRCFDTLQRMDIDAYCSKHGNCTGYKVLTSGVSRISQRGSQGGASVDY